MSKPISESSSLKISVPMLYGYGQLNTRLQFVEHQAEMNEKTIKEMKSLQDAPIPSDVRQDEKLRRIEEEITRLRDGKGD